MPNNIDNLNGRYIDSYTAKLFNLNGTYKDDLGLTKHFSNGVLHRIGGPAVEWQEPNLQKGWYIHGKRVTELEHKLLCDLMKLKGLL